MVRRQIIWTFNCTVVFLLVTGWLRPTWFTAGVPIDQLYAQKLSWTPQYDIVLAGDSRTEGGLSPAVMQRYLPGHRICNFAFGGLGFTDKYLRAAESKLDPHSQKRTMVIGIQPENFRQNTARRNLFVSSATAHPADRWFTLHLGGAASFFRPYEYWEIRAWMRKDKTLLFQNHHADGWVASHQAPDPVRVQDRVRSLQRIYTNEEISPRIVEQLLENVSRLAKSGVRVYAVRIPTSHELRRAEEEYTQFEKHRFRQRFEEAGGVWLTIPTGEYVKCYDGSHLNEQSAVVFSRKVAEAIKLRSESSE